MTGYLQAVPYEIEEAAMVDGASTLRVLWNVTAPLALPGLATVAIYAFVTTWNEFLFALTLISSEELKPITVGIFTFQGEFITKWNFLMAAATLATIPPVVMFYFIQRAMVRGLTAGGLR